MIVDANGPVAGLSGVYREPLGRKYFKGPHPPRLGDLTDTELAITACDGTPAMAGR